MTNASDSVFSRQVTRTVSFPVLEYGPAAPQRAPLPLVLFLHGASEKGTGGALLQQSDLPLLIEAGLDLPALVVCPQCPPGPGWSTNDLDVLLDALIARDDVDAEAVHLAGISMGARGAWDLAYARAGDIASITSVAGFGIPTLAPRVAGVPSWIAHGVDDDIVPAARSAEMAAALAAAGADVRYAPLEDVGHECGKLVFGDPALWAWMLSRRRRRRKSGEQA